MQNKYQQYSMVEADLIGGEGKDSFSFEVATYCDTSLHHFVANIRLDKSGLHLNDSNDLYRGECKRESESKSTYRIQ